MAVTSSLDYNSYVIITIILFLDLLQMLRDPFKPESKRFKWYYLLFGLFWLAQVVARVFFFPYKVKDELQEL